MSALKRNLIAVAAIVMGCLLSGLTSAQSEGNPELLRARDEGVAALKAEDWEGAIAAADRGIALDSDGLFTPIYFIKAEALRELEDYADAIKFNTQALQADDTFAQAYNSRGICLRELGQMELALNDFRNASEYDRNDPLIAANLGDILVNTYQKPTEALPYLDRAIEKNPEDAEAYRNRGTAHAMLKEYENGMADLDKAIQLDPKDYKTYQIIASVHLAEEEYQPAIDAISKAIESYKPEESSQPDSYIGGYQMRAETRLKLAKEKTTTPEQSHELYDAVVGDADVILTEFPDRFPESGVALYFRGKALRMQEKFAEAITSLTDAIQQIPPGRDSGYVGEAYLLRGICWFYQDQNSLARGDFREAASQSIEDPRPYLWLGFTAAKEGEYPKAIDYYGEAAARQPTFSLAYVNRGLAYMQLKDYKKAIDNFNEAIRAEPTEPKHFYKRGRAHELLNEAKKALDSYQLALLRDGDSEDANRGAARAMRALGRPNLGNQYENRVNP